MVRKENVCKVSEFIVSPCSSYVVMWYVSTMNKKNRLV